MLDSWNWKARALLVAAAIGAMVLAMQMLAADGEPSLWAGRNGMKRVRVDGRPLHRVNVYCPGAPVRRFVSIGEWDTTSGRSLTGFTDYATGEPFYTSCPFSAEPVMQKQGAGGRVPSAQEILDAAAKGGKDGKNNER